MHIKKGNPQITHFYNNIVKSDVPIWALFEIMTMGDFGYLLSCLTYDVRNHISRQLSLNVSCDTDRQLIYKYIYTLKDLRNAMKQCLKLEIGLPYVNFKTIGDYIILLVYYLKLLEVSKREVMEFVEKFEKITRDYRERVNPDVSAIVIHPDFMARMNQLKNFI